MLPTSAPNSVKVSMRTAVWMVMWRQPAILAPFKGLVGPYRVLISIKPGISFSASLISLRPQSARLISANKMTRNKCKDLKTVAWKRAVSPHSFARRGSCALATKIPHWWCKLCPESGQEFWLVDVVAILFQLQFNWELSSYLNLWKDYKY